MITLLSDTCLIYCVADMTRPVHRHLVEQRWREDGRLDLLVGPLQTHLGWPDYK